MSRLFETEGVPAKIAGRRVIGELGRGAMATIYLTEEPGAAGSLTAVKLIHAHLADQAEFLDLFSSEARIAARVRHPNVVAVHELGHHADRPCLAMEYVRGETLFALLERTWNEGRPLPHLVGAEIVRQAALGLHAAHELLDPSGRPLEVIHRDVGPHNLLVGYDGVVKVTDFGVAKAMDRSVGTQPGVFRGALPFLSPEAVRGEALDRRSDVFSLGVVLYEATVGQRLFKHKTAAGTMARILELEIPRPRAVRSDYPAPLEAIVLQALERDRGRRPQTARELAEALERFLERETEREGPELVRRLMAEVFSDQLAARTRFERSGAALSLASSLSAPAALPNPAPVELEPQGAREPVTEIVTEVLPPSPPRAHTPVRVLSEIGRAPRPAQGARWFPYALTAVGLAGLVAVLLIVLGPKAVAPPEPPPPPTVTLSFQVEPADAELRVNGQPQTGELVVPLSPDAYTVEASALGYLPQRLVVSAEASRAIEIRLEPEPEPKKKPKRIFRRTPRRRAR